MRGKGYAVLITIVLATAFCTVGCGKMVKPDRGNGYSTQYALSAVEYTVFLSEQTAVVENVLVTRLSMANSVADGTYEASKEIENTEEALSKIESVKTEVLTTMPAQGYETDRQTMLDQIEDVRLVLENYKSSLSSESKQDLKSCAEEMKACYVALSGEANVLYE